MSPTISRFTKATLVQLEDEDYKAQVARPPLP